MTERVKCYFRLRKTYKIGRDLGNEVNGTLALIKLPSNMTALGIEPGCSGYEPRILTSELHPPTGALDKIAYYLSSIFSLQFDN